MYIYIYIYTCIYIYIYINNYMQMHSRNLISHSLTLLTHSQSRNLISHSLTLYLMSQPHLAATHSSSQHYASNFDAETPQFSSLQSKWALRRDDC